jgi:hypothetical protein
LELSDETWPAPCQSHRYGDRVLTEDEYRPDEAYLQLLGEFTFWVAHLEWTVLGDLAASANNVPGIDVVALLGDTTNGIAKQLQRMIPTWSEAPKLTAWATLAVEALTDAARRRNHVLHARPATNDDDQRILLRHRWVGPERSVERFWVTKDYLREQIATIKQWDAQLEPLRGENVGLDEVFFPE